MSSAASALSTLLACCCLLGLPLACALDAGAASATEATAVRAVAGAESGERVAAAQQQASATELQQLVRQTEGIMANASAKSVLHSALRANSGLYRRAVRTRQACEEALDEVSGKYSPIVADHAYIIPRAYNSLKGCIGSLQDVMGSAWDLRDESEFENRGYTRSATRINRNSKRLSKTTGWIQGQFEAENMVAESDLSKILQGIDAFVKQLPTE